MRGDACGTTQGFDPVEVVDEFVLILRDSHDVLFRHEPSGGHLMIVAMLTEGSAARHDQDRFAEFQCRDDGAHACMGDDSRSLRNASLELGRRHGRLTANMLRDVFGGADLRNHVGSIAGARPGIDGTHQAIERQLNPNRYEDHMTEPS